MIKTVRVAVNENKIQYKKLYTVKTDCFKKKKKIFSLEVITFATWAYIKRSMIAVLVSWLSNFLIIMTFTFAVIHFQRLHCLLTLAVTLPPLTLRRGATSDQMNLVAYAPNNISFTGNLSFQLSSSTTYQFSWAHCMNYEVI